MVDPLERLRNIPWVALEGLAEEVLPAVEMSLKGQPAEQVVDRLLRHHQRFTAHQRTVAVAAVFGVSLWRRRISYCVGTSDWTRVSPRLHLFSLMRDLGGVRSEDARRLSGLPESESLPEPRPTPEGFGDRFSLPDWLADSLRDELGDEAEAFAGAVNVPGPIFLRANRLKTNREVLACRLESERLHVLPCAFAPNGLTVAPGQRPNLLGLPSHQDGLFEVQDEGSQLLGHLVGARPGERVLDYCAGAGGKALLLAAEMRNEGVLFVHDVDEVRLNRLDVRRARAGITCLRRWRPSEAPVDRVLVDAPCSELGALRRGPDVRFRLSKEATSAFPEQQARILEEAQIHVRAGGRLVYATCTVRRAENEGVVKEFIGRHPAFRLERPGDDWLDSRFVRDGFFRSFPHRDGTDGFFAAVFVRTS